MLHLLTFGLGKIKNDNRSKKLGEGAIHSFISQMGVYKNLGGGFKYFLFSPLVGEDFQID